MSTDMDALVERVSDDIWTVDRIRVEPEVLRRMFDRLADQDKRTLIEREGKWKMVAAADLTAAQRYADAMAWEERPLREVMGDPRDRVEMPTSSQPKDPTNG